MSDEINNRKIEHLQAFERDPAVDRNTRAFDAIQLRHRALPNVDFNSIDTSTTFLGKKLSFPLLISSMTGGEHALVKKINHNLAIAAEACNVAMAVGSQRVMFGSTEAEESFSLRNIAPNTVLIGNIGAVQLNYGFSVEQCQRAVDVLGADALYLHLNPLQEAIQPEGDTNFAELGSKIPAVCEKLSVPVLLKEVGCGLSVADIQDGYAMGVRYFDVAGSGGTSWSRIEHHRRVDDGSMLGLTFQDWGIPTPEALQEAYAHVQNTGCDATLIASGGLKTGVDIAKSVIMGAALGGLAVPLLAPAMVSADATISKIKEIQAEFTTAMFLLGCQNISQLVNNAALIRHIKNK